MRWYFARPTSDNGTEFETAIREHFAVFHLENPNATLHLNGYSAVGIEYLFFAIAMLPAYDGCIAIELPNGQWSTGVTREVNWFLRHERPVLHLCYDVKQNETWTFHLKLLTALIHDTYTVEQTRAFIHYYQKRPLGGRSYADREIGAHAPDWADVGLAEPERVMLPPVY